MVKKSFPSYNILINAALNFVQAMRILHSKGYCYCDMLPYNIWIDVKTGDIKISDSGDIVIDGCVRDCYYNLRYQAPEIITEGRAAPNALSNRYSIGIILFRLFCMSHPMEGKKCLISVTTEEYLRNLYESPVFMFDREDDSNRPDNTIHHNAIMSWSVLPEYIKDLFYRTFCKRSYEAPSSRPVEKEWIDALMRFKSSIVKCKCGNEVFTDNGNSCICDECGEQVQIPFKIQLTHYAVPAVKGKHIYRGQLGICSIDYIFNNEAVIVEHKQNKILGIKNKSGEVWKALTTQGKIRFVQPEEVIPLKNGIKFYPYGSETMIIQSDDAELPELFKPEKKRQKEIIYQSMPKRIVPVIIVADTSKSMEGEGIDCLNYIIGIILENLRNISISETCYKIAILEYNTHAKWVEEKLTDIREFSFEYFKADGISDLGQALHILNESLSKEKLFSEKYYYYRPIIIFMGNGDIPMSYMDYKWNDELENIQKNQWFEKALKLAVSNGKSTEILAEVVSSPELVISSGMLEDEFKRIFVDRLISIS